MKISEVSNITGVSIDMIRHYEKLGLIRPQRADNGYREFSEKDSFEIVLIKQFNSLGISLRTMQKYGLTNSAHQYDELRENLRKLEEEERWLKSRISNARNFVDIFYDVSRGRDYSLIDYPVLYYYSHPMTLAGFSRRAPEILQNLGAFRYCFRIRKEHFTRDFPVDIGFLSQVDLPKAGVSMSKYERVRVYRTYSYVDQDRMLRPEDLAIFLQKMEKHGLKAEGDCFITQLSSARDGEKDLLCFDFIIGS